MNSDMPLHDALNRENSYQLLCPRKGEGGQIHQFRAIEIQESLGSSMIAVCHACGILHVHPQSSKIAFCSFLLNISLLGENKARQESESHSLTFPELCLRNHVGRNTVRKLLSYKNMSVFQIHSKKKNLSSHREMEKCH